MKPAKTINKFNQSHESLRRFLRLISYGCYHRMLFNRHGIKQRTYDDELRQMRFFIPKDCVIESRQAGHTHVSFRGSPYTQPQNFLFNSFLLKSFLPDVCLHTILILQITAKSGQPMTLSEIMDEAELAISEHDPDYINGNADLVQLIRRRINELVEVGLLTTCGKGRSTTYQASLQPLDGLSSDEAQILLSAVNFYKNVALISVPGCLLALNLLELFPALSACTSFFQFKNNNFTRILDDEIVLAIIEAINSQKALSIGRKDKADLKILPSSISTDYFYNRQYLVGHKIISPSKSEPVSLRIDMITKAVPAEASPVPAAASRNKLVEVRIRATYTTPAERAQREKELMSQGAQLTGEETNAFLCSICTPDPLHLYPWLCSLQPWAEILPGPDGLRQRLEKDLQEMLANYELATLSSSV